MSDPERIDSTTELYGIADDDWEAMNSLKMATKEERGAVYAEQRLKHAGNALALETIDIFDPWSPYSRAKVEYLEAIQTGNTDREQELLAWFKENYPLSEARNA